MRDEIAADRRNRICQQDLRVAAAGQQLVVRDASGAKDKLCACGYVVGFRVFCIAALVPMIMIFIGSGLLIFVLFYYSRPVNSPKTESAAAPKNGGLGSDSKDKAACCRDY
jgi:hypothetical protein